MDNIALEAFSQLAHRAEPKLAAELARLGVASADQLAPEIAAQIVQETLLKTAAEHFPQAQLDALKHGLAAFSHPRFSPAFARLKQRLTAPADAFAMATGLDAAIVLAGFGFPVAPFDRKNPKILAEPSNVIDEVVEMFSRYKTAFVGYSPSDIPFYMLITDCMQTMRSQIINRPQLNEAKLLLKRAGAGLPTGPFPSFKHGVVLIPREPGDTISTVFLSNPDPAQGSVGLYAGWSVDGVRDGAPNEGFLPVPMQFLEAALKDVQLAMWVWRPVGLRVTLN